MKLSALRVVAGLAGLALGLPAMAAADSPPPAPAIATQGAHAAAPVPAGTLASYEAYVRDFSVGVGIAGLEYVHGPEELPGVLNRHFFLPDDRLQYFNAKGVKSIRLPFLWERLQPEVGGPLDPVYLGFIRHALRTAIGNGQRILLDPHNYGARYVGTRTFGIGTPQVPIEAFADFWRKVAVALKDDGQGLIGFDIMNEPSPRNIEKPETWATAAQAAIDAIREVDGGTLIFVEGWRFSNPYNWARDNPTLHEIRDPANRVVISMHQYFDKDRTGTYDSADGSYTGEGGDRSQDLKHLQTFVDWIRHYGFSGHVGEFGAPPTADWVPTMNQYMDGLREAGLPFHAWGGFTFGSKNVLNLSRTPSGVDRLQGTEIFKRLPDVAASKP